jgi:sulfoxide reductase heme-binding subunit YedZ
MKTRQGKNRSAGMVALKIGVWILCLTPLGILTLEFLQDRLGANPIERITHLTGFFGLTFLVAALAITPLRRLSGWNGAIKLRRPIGLFGFFYVCLHFLTYLVLDHFFDWETIVEDIMDRPYITVGFTALVLLIPLAITSTKGWIRRLGRRWQMLHRLAYLAAGLGVLHFFWKEKADTREPLVFAAVLIALLLFRLPLLLKRKAIARKAASRSSPSPAPAPVPERVSCQPRQIR